MGKWGEVHGNTNALAQSPEEGEEPCSISSIDLRHTSLNRQIHARKQQAHAYARNQQQEHLLDDLCFDVEQI